MVRSMTGYGRAKQERNGRSITVEVRSVNNRYLDCTVKMPRAYIFAEDAMKALVQKSISRGKVDVFVTMDAAEADQTVVQVNEPLAKTHMACQLGVAVGLGRRVGDGAFGGKNLVDALRSDVGARQPYCGKVKLV